MKRLFLFLAVSCVFAASSVWATPSYVWVDNPNYFTESVDWCTLTVSGCSATLSTPSTWTSSPSGLTGQAGMFYSGNTTPTFTVSADPSGMGLINSTTYVIGEDSYVDDIAATFDVLAYGAGAYIETNYVGTVYASVYLFNNVYNQLARFTWTADFTGAPGESIFIGAASSDPEVAIVIFDVSDYAQGITQPFSIGTMGFNAVPEPGSLALMATALFGIAALLRRRARKV